VKNFNIFFSFVVNYTKLGPYEMFCGKECGVALAKMSFKAKHIGDLKGCSDLNFGEKTELEECIENLHIIVTIQSKAN
jgi:hypothetical protein